MHKFMWQHKLKLLITHWPLRRTHIYSVYVYIQEVPCIHVALHSLFSGCTGTTGGVVLSPGEILGGPYNLLTCSLSLSESSVFRSIPLG